ncbi:MAG: cysteine desulfurase/selenocysteine lyase [Candidatus Nitrosomirales archaeon]|jgi:cysteine desulfurase/selenocysteine lyase
MNNASNAPVPFYTIKAMTDFLIECSENGPDSPTMLDNVEHRMQEARKDVAKFINCEPEEVVFTQSTTEGINYVANGLALKKGENIIIRDGDHEHPANYVPWMRLKEKGIEVKKLEIDENGFFDLDKLEKKIDSGTKLVAISHALFNTGAILPAEKVGEIAESKKVRLCLDAAQTVGCFPVDVKKLKCDFMAFTGSKWLCGPMGTGIFYCSKDASAEIEPLQSGGESAFVLEGEKFSHRDMPQKMQAGFRNWVGIVGLAASVRYITRTGINIIREKNMKLANMLRQELMKLQNVTLYGPEDENIRTSVVSFNVGKVEPSTVVKKLEDNGIIFAKRDISRKKIVRASPHFFNQIDSIQRAVDVIKKLQ